MYYSQCQLTTIVLIQNDIVHKNYQAITLWNANRQIKESR